MKNKFPRGVEVVGAPIIENLKGEILLVKQPKWSNKWTLPGGHVEPGEKIEDAIMREAEEEVGLKLKNPKFITHGELIGSRDFYRPAHFVFYDYAFKTADENVKIDENEISEFKWVKPQDALKMDLAETYGQTIMDFIKFKNKK